MTETYPNFDDTIVTEVPGFAGIVWMPTSIMRWVIQKTPEGASSYTLQQVWQTQAYSPRGHPTSHVEHDDPALSEWRDVPMVRIQVSSEVAPGPKSEVRQGAADRPKKRFFRRQIDQNLINYRINNT